MAKSTIYFIGEIEYTQGELIKAASDMGWSGFSSGAVAVSIESAVTSAIKYLISKGCEVKSMIVMGVKPPTIHKIPPKTDKSPVIVEPDKIVDPTIMTIYYEDGIYSVDTTHVDDSSCWDVQLFGSSVCSQCNYNYKELCSGREIVEFGMNNLGHDVPLAVKIADRARGKEDDGAEIT